MSPWATIRRFLAALAIVGLVLAPVVTPVMAVAADSQGAMSNPAEMTGDDAMVMLDGMPCCPQDQQNDCAKNCPLMAACVASLHSTLPSYGFSVPVTRASAVTLRNDRILDSLSQAPPPRPPKA